VTRSNQAEPKSGSALKGEGCAMPLPKGSDKTTDTDESLLADAANAKLPLVEARHEPGESEHPVGRTEAGPARSGKRTARRTPRAGRS
jgi:hypothetical protein